MSDLWENPLGTDGFEFIDYAAPDPEELAALFVQLGFRPVARHRSKRVTLYRQGDVNFILNAEPDSFAQSFARLHGPNTTKCVPVIGGCGRDHINRLVIENTTHVGDDLGTCTLSFLDDVGLG